MSASDAADQPDADVTDGNMLIANETETLKHIKMYLRIRPATNEEHFQDMGDSCISVEWPCCSSICTANVTGILDYISPVPAFHVHPCLSTGDLTGTVLWWHCSPCRVGVRGWSELSLLDWWNVHHTRRPAGGGKCWHSAAMFRCHL